MGGLLLSGAFTACTWDDVTDVGHGYPDDITELMRSNCATSGCHDATSAINAAGLNLGTWKDLFKGARGGSPVVPYNPEESYLLQFLNTDTSWLPAISPTMPLNQGAYTPLQLQRIITWIEEGARNANGEERFPPQADRKKWYVVNRLCDKVTVFDAESRQVMRVVEVGTDDLAIEEGHDIIVAPDGLHWYVTYMFWSPFVEVYSTLTDEKVGNITLDRHGYSHLAISPDSRYMFALTQFQRRISVVDLQSLQVVFGPMTVNEFMGGLAVHPSRSEVYFGSSQSEYLFVMDYDNAGQLSNQRTVDLVQHIPAASSSLLVPYDIKFLSDGSNYFVTCTETEELRIFDAATDSLLASVPTGAANPRKIAIAESTGHLYISCETETDLHGGDPKKMGAIAVIDYRSATLEDVVYTGFMPNGLAVDEATGVVVVAHRNRDPDAPPSHHGATCDGRNGNVTLIDLQTREVIADYKPELSVDPFRVAVK